MIADRISDRKSPSLLHSNFGSAAHFDRCTSCTRYICARLTALTDTWRTPRHRASSIVPGSPALAHSRLMMAVVSHPASRTECPGQAGRPPSHATNDSPGGCMRADILLADMPSHGHAVLPPGIGTCRAPPPGARMCAEPRELRKPAASLA